MSASADEPVLLIRRARPADAADFSLLMREPEIFGSLLQLPMPSEEFWRKRLESHAEPNSGELHLVAERGGRVVGSAGLIPTGPLRRRHAAGMGISVLPEAQGRGVGTALMQALCDYADRWGQLLRIELHVFVDNEHALALYRRFDFRLEGTHRAFALRDGVYADVHSMARLHPNPPRAAWPAD